MTKEDPNTRNDENLRSEVDPSTETQAEAEPGVISEAEEPGEVDPEGEEEDLAPALQELEDAPEISPESEDSELASLREELGRLRDQHVRLAADFENYRKRTGAELAGVWVRARADLIRSLVEGLDDLQRVSQFTSEDTTVEALIAGVDLVERNILKALTEAGLEVLWPEGEKFDPNHMEAMMRVPAEEDDQDDTVHQVFQKGYMFKDQLVRPARVSVYKDDD